MVISCIAAPQTSKNHFKAVFIAFSHPYPTEIPERGEKSKFGAFLRFLWAFSG